MSVSTSELEDSTIYKVVINHEEQYSIWPERRENPRGWTSPGVTGSKAECLNYIESVWTDMRPLSLRKAVEEAKAKPAKENGHRESGPAEESLPVRLSAGTHPVELSLRPERNLDALLRQVKAGCLHVRFTGTRGGTELSVPLETSVVHLIADQIARGEKAIQVIGALTLDYTRVRCFADIDVSTFAGSGRLELLTD